MTLSELKEIYSLIISPVLDYFIIALIIYSLLYFMRGTRGASIFAGCALALTVLTLFAEGLNFKVLYWLLSQFWAIAPVTLAVIFHPEIRRAFAQLGSTYFPQRSDVQMTTIREIGAAVTQLSRSKTGALIVFERKIGLASIKNTAVELDAKVQSKLLQSIFFPNSPLHDGALIIRGNVIQAAHAILPHTQNPEFSRMNIGTRHSAAIGVTEETDAVAIVVSEETGFISLAVKGKLYRNLSADKLCEMLKKILLDRKAEESPAEKPSAESEKEAK